MIELTAFIIFVLVLAWFVTVAWYDRKVSKTRRTAENLLRQSFHQKVELQAELLVTQLERDAWMTKHLRSAGRIFDGLAKERPAEAYELHVASVGNVLDVKL